MTRPTMNSLYALLLLGITLQIVSSSNTPTITFISPKHIGNVGGTVNLQCSAKNAQDVPVVWAKIGEDNVYISHGMALTVPDNRYSLKHNQTSSTFTLKIDHLQSEDAGLYQCILIIAHDNRATADVELEVHPTETSDK